jgi:hypothetical protein
VYGSTNPDRQRIEQTVRKAVEKADFEKLAKQSKSFRHFHEQVEKLLKNYPAT